MKCKCRRCRTESSVFWYPFVVGYPAGEQDIDPEDVIYLCDRCAYDLSLFMPMDLYMLKERIE